jgi:hypothetical protein
MMLDEPVCWDETVEKGQVIGYVFKRQRVTKANDAMLAQYGATPDIFLGLTPSAISFSTISPTAGSKVFNPVFLFHNLNGYPLFS